MSSSPGWRAASTCAPMSRRWRRARSACSPAATPASIRPRRCRSRRASPSMARWSRKCRSNGSRAGAIFRAATASSRGCRSASVVVEAARGSGSLITAKFALEQNREVFAVPGSPLDPRAEGANDLLARGRADLRARRRRARHRSIPCARKTRSRCSARIRRRQRAAVGRIAAARRRPRDGAARQARPGVRRGGAAAASRRARTSAIAEVERLLGPSPISLDELAEVSGLPMRQVRVAVMMLELAGRIEHSGGARVALLPEG